MKRFLVLVSMLIFVGSVRALPTETTIKEDTQTSVVDGMHITPSPMLTFQKAWNVLASTLSADVEPNDLAVTERTYLTVKALAEGGDSKITIVRLPRYWNDIRFRCIGITDNSTVTFQLYQGTLGKGTDCELVKVAQLAFTIGTQSSTVSTYEMADTLTVTTYCYTGGISSISPLNELTAECKWDLQGDDILVIVPTTVGCNAKLLAKGY